MSLLAIFFNAWGVGFSGAIMPGPLLTVNIQESYQRGWTAGPLMVLGHAILETVLVVGLMLGLDRLISQSITQGIVGLVGGAVLLWMAWGMLLNGGKEGLSLENRAELTGKRMHPVLAGAVVSLSNPYWSLWWATIGLGLMVHAKTWGTMGLALFLIGHLMADLVWYTVISIAIATGRHVIPSRFFRGLIMVCGFFLIYLSLKDFIPRGLETLGVVEWVKKLV